MKMDVLCVCVCVWDRWSSKPWCSTLFMHWGAAQSKYQNL
jgi:hypothetical protein